jgi:hypothetical protein
VANPGTDVSFDLTTANGQLKQYYRKIEFEKLVYEHMPAVGIVPKDEDLQGENWKQPVAFAPSPNRSATFTYGQNPWFYASNGTANQSLTQSSVTGIGFPQVTAFVVTPVQDYGFGYIDRMTKMLSETSEGAFEDTAVTAMSMAMKAVMLSLGNAIYGTGTGTIGQISAGSNVASPTITLNDPNQVVNFYVGQVVVATATDGGAVKGGNTQGCGALIVAIDRNLGTLTVGTALGSGTTAPTTANWSTLINGNGGTAVVAGDYLCQAGDAANAGTYLKIAGFGAWVPASAVASTDSFFGVNRYADTFLSGVRINGVGLEIEEALMEGAAAGARQGALLDTCLMNFANWTVLQYALTARKTYFQNVDAKVMSSDGNIGYSTIKIEGPTGTIDVIPDPFCPSTQIFILQKDTWSLKTVGKAVSPFDFNTEKPSSMDDEKATLLRTVNSDSYEFRCGMYGNLSCSAPGWNVNITVTAPSVL